MMDVLQTLKDLFPQLDCCADMDLNSLIAYVAYKLDVNNIPVTFEHIYVGAFLSFPKRFCLVGFEDYPDGARINRSIMQCGPKYQNLLVGTAKEGYHLTEFGKIRARKVMDVSTNPSGQSSSDVDQNKAERTVDHKKKIALFRKKSAYKKFIEGKSADVGADEIFEFLGLSPFDHKLVIRKKLQELEAVAKHAGSDELTGFVKWLRKNKEFKLYFEKQNEKN